MTLRNALRDLRRSRDLILIDCPPTLGPADRQRAGRLDHAILSTEAAVLLAPGDGAGGARSWSSRGTASTPSSSCSASCLNIANMRTRHARQTLDALQERFGDKLFRTVIRQSIAYAESAERAVPILDYRPDRGADYLSLAGEILRRLGKQELLEPLDELSAEVVAAGTEPGPA